jgi:hypothetical protein
MLNGIALTNGYVHAPSLLPSRPPSSNDSRMGHRLTPTLTPPRRLRGQTFLESPAIVRTAEGMAAVLELEQSLETRCSRPPGPSSNAQALDDLLRSYMGESNSDAEGETESDDEEIAVDSATGDKRKAVHIHLSAQCHTSNADNFPAEMVSPTPVMHQRARLSSPRPSDTIEL